MCVCDNLSVLWCSIRNHERCSDTLHAASCSRCPGNQITALGGSTSRSHCSKSRSKNGLQPQIYLEIVLSMSKPWIPTISSVLAFLGSCFHGNYNVDQSHLITAYRYSHTEAPLLYTCACTLKMGVWLRPAHAILYIERTNIRTRVANKHYRNLTYLRFLHYVKFYWRAPDEAII